VTRLGSPIRDVRAAALVVVAVAALVHTNTLWNQFAYDDVHQIVENEAIQSLETLPGALVRPYWPDDYGRELGLWRPATTATLGLLHAAGDGGPVLFHLANVLAHAAVSVLVLLLSATLMPLTPSLVGSLVFAVHPLHVEAVANAIGIAEILSALAILAACLVHIRAPERTGWPRALAMGALYAVAFGAKESGVTLPGLIFLVDAARKRIAFGDLASYMRDRWRPYLVMAVVAVALLVGRYAVLGSIANPFAPLGADILAEIPRIWTLGEVWTHYVRLWVFPLDLASDYSPNVIPISFSWHATNVVGVVVVIGILLMTLVAWRSPVASPGGDSAKSAAFGIVWFVVAVSPIANVVFLSGVLLAERTLYLPSVGLAVATGWLAGRVARERPRLAWAALALALAAGSYRTWIRNPEWRDNQAVFNTMLRDIPHSGRSQWILGDEFLKAGSVQQGLLAYRAAIDMLGGHYTVVTDISQRLMGIGNYRAAESLLRFSWRERPELPLAPSLIAWIRAQHGDASGTEHWSRLSLERYEPDPSRWYLLAWALAAQGEWDEALEARRRGEELGRALFWHQWMYRAYVRRHEGDEVGALEAVDSAWATVTNEVGRIAIDSVRVTVFGLAPLLTADSVSRETAFPGGRAPAGLNR